MKETIRLNFEFPREEYAYLKMLCIQRGISFKDLATELLINAIEEYEDDMLAKKAASRLQELKNEENISWDEACQLAGWDEKKIRNKIQ